MLTTDDLGLSEYIFQSSPESCSDHSYSAEFMDVTSDEDFLTQLSLDLDIPLYLNPGEDELGLLNSYFDKSPEEILSDIASPSSNMEDFSKEDNEIKNIAFPSYNAALSTGPYCNIKREKSSPSGSEKSISPVQSDLIIKEELLVKTPPLSPTIIGNNANQFQDVQNKIIYTEPLEVRTPSQGSLITVCPKQIPIVPKTQFTIPTPTTNNIMVLNTDIKPVFTAPPQSNVLVVDNINLNKNLRKINVEPSTSVNVVPRVMINNVNRFTSSILDPSILKKQQRKIKNRESASLSRKKKKDYMTSLEEQVKELRAENQRLLNENAQLKEKLVQYENQEFTQNKNKPFKSSVVLCMVLLVVGVNLDLIRNPLSTRKAISINDNNIPKILDHHGRSLLWTPDELKNDNDTSNFFPFTMCPAAVNQTESARLASELERWIRQPTKMTPNVDRNITKPIKKRKKMQVDSPFVSIYRRFSSRFRNGNLDNLNPPKTAIQVFSSKPKQTHSDFFEAINRQEDTFYVVSITDQHMLLPALHHNKTQRPKMSLIMPSVLSNGSFSQGSMVQLMQIDCEVLNTRLIHVKHGLIPQHLRSYPNVTKEKSSTSPFNFSNPDIPKYYKKLYKPYFMNKVGVKPNTDFFNININ